MASRVQIVINVDSDRAEEAVGKVRSAVDGLGATTVKSTREGTKGFQELSTGGIAVATTAATVLAGALGQAFDRLQQVAQTSVQLAVRVNAGAAAQKALADQTGLSIGVLEAQTRQIEANRVSVFEAQRALSLFAGAQLDTNLVVRLSDIAFGRAAIAGRSYTETFERLTQAVLKAEPELIDEFGLIVRRDDAYQRYAASVGKSTDALTNQERVLAVANEVFRQTANDVGIMENTFAELGPRLADIERRVENAGIAVAQQFTPEVKAAVETSEDFLEAIERNPGGVAGATRAVLALAGGFTALTLAMNLAAGSGVVALFTRIRAAIGFTTVGVGALTAALTGGAGAIGLVGAWAAVAAAGVGIGYAINQVITAIRSHNEMAKVATLDVGQWREMLESAGVTVRNNEEAMTLLARIRAANNNLVEAGLPPLRLTSDLMERLTEAERRFASAAGDSTIELAKRQQQLESFRERLQQRTFRAGLEGLGPEERILAQSAEEIRKIQQQLRELPEAAQQAQQTIEDINQETATKIAELREKETTAAVDAALEVIDKQVDAIARIEDRREGELAKFRDLAQRFPALREIFGQAEIAAVANAEAEITKIRRDEFLKQEEAARELTEKRVQLLQQVEAIERQNALDRASPLERIEIERLEAIRDFEKRINVEAIGDAEKRAEAIELLRRNEAAENEKAAIAIIRENERIFDEQARLLDRNAQQFEFFWDRVIRGAKSTGDFLSNLWNELANQFRRFVLQSVAQWVFGQRQIQSSAAGIGGAGGFAGLLGGIFGSPGTASARTPPFVSSLFEGGGLTSAAGGAIPGVGGAGAGSSGVPLGVPGLGSAGLPGLFGGSLGFGGSGAGVPPVLGLLLGLEGARRGRPGLGAALGVGGVLGGVAASGAAAGIAGGIGALGGIGVGLAGFLTNPVGLAILGGVAGISAIVGIVQRGRKKEDATEIANDGFAQITELVAQYQQHQATFESTINAMNRIWSQMEGAWRQIGGAVGNNSIRDQRRYFDQYVDQVEMIRRERERRGVLISNLPVPQFHNGGFVGAPVGNVHAGEFVIRREAVQEVGVPMLRRINEGQSSGGGDSFHIEIHTPDKHGVAELLRNNADQFKRAIVAYIKQSRGEFGLR